MMEPMLDEELTRMIADRGGLLLEDGHSLVIFDRNATRYTRLRRDAPLDSTAEDSLRRVGEILKESPNGPPPRPLIVAVHVLISEDGSCGDVKAVTRVLKAFPDDFLQLYLYRTSSALWEPLEEWIGTLRRWQPDPRRLLISVIGVFGTIEDVTKTFLFDNRVHLQAVNGWWPGCAVEDHTLVREEEARNLAEFGFESPALWNVHAGNVDHLPELVDSSLVANCYAGFSVLPFAQSPLYTGLGGPGSVTSDEYLNLLVQLYEDHPRYDRLFAPLNELAGNCVVGGWDERKDQPTRIKLLFRSDDQARVYRQVPFLSHLWEASTTLEVTALGQIRASLIELHRRVYSLIVHPLCASCEWRTLCGGVDHTWQERGEPAPAGLMAMVCDHRRLFLEAFVLQRCQSTPDAR